MLDSCRIEEVGGILVRDACGVTGKSGIMGKTQ